MNSPEALNLYSDVLMDVEAQIDRSVLTVRQILELAPGSVIPLDRSAGEYVDILIGGAPIGQGEIVAARDPAAIRISRLREED